MDAIESSELVLWDRVVAVAWGCTPEHVGSVRRYFTGRKREDSKPACWNADVCGCPIGQVTRQRKAVP